MRRKLRGSLFPTSALGQKRTFGHVRVMSALPTKADIAWHGCLLAWTLQILENWSFTPHIKLYSAPQNLEHLCLIRERASSRNPFLIAIKDEKPKSTKH